MKEERCSTSAWGSAIMSSRCGHVCRLQLSAPYCKFMGA